MHYKGQSLPIDAIKEKCNHSKHSPFCLELAGFDNEKLISHLSFYKPRPHHPFESHVGEFAIKILREYCSHGLGSKMMQVMESIAKEMDVKRIQARVRTLNQDGVRFYQKHDYEIEGLRKHAVFINGAFEDEYYIGKVL